MCSDCALDHCIAVPSDAWVSHFPNMKVAAYLLVLRPASFIICCTVDSKLSWSAFHPAVALIAIAVNIVKGFVPDKGSLKEPVVITH